MTQTVRFGDSSADVSASVKHIFPLFVVNEWKANTHFHTAVASVTLGEFGRLCIVIKNSQFIDLTTKTFFSFSLLFFEGVSPWFYLCVHVFVSFSVLFNLKGSVSLSFSSGSPVTLIKAMEWLANQGPSHPTNLESSFSHNNFTRPGKTSVCIKDMELIVNVFVCVLMLRRKDPDFLKSRGWVTGTQVLWGRLSNVYILYKAMKPPFPLGFTTDAYMLYQDWGLI